MIDQLKTHIQNRDNDGILTLLKENQQVLDLQDDTGSSGYMLIAYGGLGDVFTKATELKKSFTFFEAIISGQMSLVIEHIVRDKSIVNSFSSDGFTPLSLAAFFDQIDIAQLLLSSGADPNLHATNPSKVNALHSAVAKGNIDLCKLLLDKGVDVNSVQMQNVTALHSASHRGILPLVQLLVENGALIDVKMDNGDTPIIIAERDGHSEVKEYLLSKA